MKKVGYTLPLIIAVGIFKSAALYSSSSRSTFVFWIFLSIMTYWIAWAFVNNQDMPSRGSTRYEEGNNQLARTIFFVVMLAVFAVLAVVG